MSSVRVEGTQTSVRQVPAALANSFTKVALFELLPKISATSPAVSASLKSATQFGYVVPAVIFASNAS